jgi:hypothetical protein
VRNLQTPNVCLILTLINANQGIHCRIKQIYNDDESWQRRIAEGRFEVLDSEGHTILSEDWDELVEPGMTISIRYRYRCSSGRTIEARPGYEDVYIKTGNETTPPGSRQEMREDRIAQPNSEQLQVEVDASTAIMHENIEKVSEQGDKLDSLPRITQNVELSAGIQSARRVNRGPRAYWKLLVSLVTLPAAKAPQAIIRAPPHPPVALVEHEKPSDKPALPSQDKKNPVDGTIREEILPDSASGAKGSTRFQRPKKGNGYHPPHPVPLSAHGSKTALGAPELPRPPPPVLPGASLTSATYVPSGESYGPGVGIPPRLTISENNTGLAGAAPGNQATASMERPEPTKDKLFLPLTETGRPRRSAALTFGGMEADSDSYVPAPSHRRVRWKSDDDDDDEDDEDDDEMPEEAGKRSKSLEDKARVSELHEVDELLKEWTTVS